MGAWSKHIMDNDMAMDFFDELSRKRSAATIGACLKKGLMSVSDFIDNYVKPVTRTPEDIDQEVGVLMANYIAVNSHQNLTKAWLAEKEDFYRGVLANESPELPDNEIQKTMAAAFLVAWSLSLEMWETADNELNKGKVLAAVSQYNLAENAIARLSELIEPGDERIELAKTQFNQCKQLRKKFLTTKT